MFNVEERIQELSFETKSLKAKAIIAGAFSMAQFSILFLPSSQENGVVMVGITLMGIGTALISGASAIMVKMNNDLINKYKNI